MYQVHFSQNGLVMNSQWSRAILLFTLLTTAFCCNSETDAPRNKSATAPTYSGAVSSSNPSSNINTNEETVRAILRLLIGDISADGIVLELRESDLNDANLVTSIIKSFGYRRLRYEAARSAFDDRKIDVGNIDDMSRGRDPLERYVAIAASRYAFSERISKKSSPDQIESLIEKIANIWGVSLINSQSVMPELRSILVSKSTDQNVDSLTATDLENLIKRSKFRDYVPLLRISGGIEDGALRLKDVTQPEDTYIDLDTSIAIGMQKRVGNPIDSDKSKNVSGGTCSFMCAGVYRELPLLGSTCESVTAEAQAKCRATYASFNDARSPDSSKSSSRSTDSASTGNSKNIDVVNGKINSSGTTLESIDATAFVGSSTGGEGSGAVRGGEVSDSTTAGTGTSSCTGSNCLTCPRECPYEATETALCQAEGQTYADAQQVLENRISAEAGIRRELTDRREAYEEILRNIANLRARVAQIESAEAEFCANSGPFDFNLQYACIAPSASSFSPIAASTFGRYILKAAVETVPCVGKPIWAAMEFCENPTPVRGAKVEVRTYRALSKTSSSVADSCLSGASGVGRWCSKNALKASKTAQTAKDVCQTANEFRKCITWNPVESALDIAWTFGEGWLAEIQRSTCELPGKLYVNRSQPTSAGLFSSYPPGCGANGRIQEMKNDLNRLIDEDLRLAEDIELNSLQSFYDQAKRDLDIARLDESAAASAFLTCEDRAAEESRREEYVSCNCPIPSDGDSSGAESDSGDLCERAERCSGPGWQCGWQRRGSGAVNNCGTCPTGYYCNGIATNSETNPFPWRDLSNGRCRVDPTYDDATPNAPSFCRDFALCMGQRPQIGTITSNPGNCSQVECYQWRDTGSQAFLSALCQCQPSDSRCPGSCSGKTADEIVSEFQVEGEFKIKAPSCIPPGMTCTLEQIANPVQAGTTYTLPCGQTTASAVCQYMPEVSIGTSVLQLPSNAIPAPPYIERPFVETKFRPNDDIGIQVAIPMQAQRCTATMHIDGAPPRLDSSISLTIESNRAFAVGDFRVPENSANNFLNLQISASCKWKNPDCSEQSSDTRNVKIYAPNPVVEICEYVKDPGRGNCSEGQDRYHLRGSCNSASTSGKLFGVNASGNPEYDMSPASGELSFYTNSACFDAGTIPTGSCICDSLDAEFISVSKPLNLGNY